VALVTLLPPAAASADGLDLRSWLERPGVRLVAVEFYATWCRPCMDAVPRWKELHRRWRGRGLRFVVVNTQDPDGACYNPGWTPDQMICDPEGDLAAAMQVGNKLPAAFLWSWQGHLLVRRGHVDEVEAAIDEYLRTAPRVLVEAHDAKGRLSAGLRELLRDALSANGKLEVVASGVERARLRKLRKASHALGVDDRLQCEVGKEVPANSWLRASVSGGRGARRLNLTLLSAETGCLLAAATVPWTKKQKARAAAEGVHELLSRLRTGLQRPDAEPKPAAPPQEHPVAFSTVPAGASVEVDGTPVCRSPGPTTV